MAVRPAARPHFETSGGQNDDLLPSTSFSTFDPTGQRHSLPLKQKVGREVNAYYLRPLGKVEVEGTMFLYI